MKANASYSRKSVASDFVDQAIRATTVVIVDPDLERRAQLRWFVETRGAKVTGYACANDVLSSPPAQAVGILVLRTGSLSRDSAMQLHLLRQRLPQYALLVVEGTGHSMLDLAMQCGADMQIAFDSSNDEVVAAILALHRRTRWYAPPPLKPAWLLDVATRELAAFGGIRVQLGASQVKLLGLFCEHPTMTLIPTQTLIAWMGLSAPGALHTYIYRLRKKVEDCCAIPLPLKARQKQGYVFLAPIREVWRLPQHEGAVCPVVAQASTQAPEPDTQPATAGAG